jgi:hypothetical protein
MKIQQTLLSLAVVATAAVVLSACGSGTASSNQVQFSNDDQTVTQVTPYTDEFANKPVKITQTEKLNQEFSVQYKYFTPDGVGTATFKATSIKQIDTAGGLSPDAGKKLILVEIAVRGNSKNQGMPSTFDQIGNTPSPQFVLVDRQNNKSYVEETDFSGAYTDDKNLFALSKITMDSENWVNTAIIFEVDQNLTPDLALRFINPTGDTEFYAISQ